jgi:hypothetical protein
MLSMETLMSHLRVTLCRVEDEAPGKMAELVSFDLPHNDVDALQPQSALDTLEQQTAEVGNGLLRKALEAQWEQIDAELTQKARQDFPPSARQK